MRVFHIQGSHVTETDELPSQPPVGGFVWISCARREYEVQQQAVQQTLQNLGACGLMELHVSDLLNNQLPSHYDYTSQYDLLVFRRLATARSDTDPREPGTPLHVSGHKGGPPVLRRIDTSPVGFAVFDQVLLTVHPADCAVRDLYASRLLATSQASETRGIASRVPASPADLMLRVVNLMVDGYLELRREMTRQLDHWQSELMRPHSRFKDWTAMLETRTAMHLLEEVCEDQRSAVQDWIDALQAWPVPTQTLSQRELEQLKVRSRDVLEHIERVVHHVRRMEQSAETAVQIHFTLQGQRTNDIMRTLTVLSAVFLPLNFMTGFFGMNFEFMPWIHSAPAMWTALCLMALLSTSLIVYFWRKRYLS